VSKKRPGQPLERVLERASGEVRDVDVALAGEAQELQAKKIWQIVGKQSLRILQAEKSAPIHPGWTAWPLKN
jgi:hypothetical protein